MPIIFAVRHLMTDCMHIFTSLLWGALSRFLLPILFVLCWDTIQSLSRKYITPESFIQTLGLLQVSVQWKKIYLLVQPFLSLIVSNWVSSSSFNAIIPFAIFMTLTLWHFDIPVTERASKHVRAWLPPSYKLPSQARKLWHSEY